jgi:hypothetical protein
VNGDRDGGAPSVVRVAVVYLHINRDVSRNGKTGANKFSLVTTSVLTAFELP